MKRLPVEDQVALAESVRTYLTSEGYACKWVNTCDRAVEKINLYPYDCLLVDITLPGGSGLTLCRP